MKMLQQFAVWFICFGLSYLASDVFGLTEQGKAFLYIHLGASVLIILLIIVILVIAGVAKGVTVQANGISFLIVLLTAGSLAIVLFATWGATKLFDIDFFVAYQIMTFGQCLCVTNNEK